MCEDRSIAKWCALLEVMKEWQVVRDLERNVLIEANWVRMRLGMLDSWSKLRQMGLQIGICSNLATGYGAGVLAGLPDIADVTVYSYLSGGAKPNPEVHSLVARRFGLDAKRILFVGNTLGADVEGPKCTGTVAMHINECARLRS